MTSKNIADLKRRLFASCLLLPIIILLIYFSQNPYVKVLFLLAVLFFGAVGVWEYLNLAMSRGATPKRRFVILCAVALILSYFFSWQTWPAIVLFLSAVVFFVTRFNKLENAIATIAIEFFALVYVAVPLGLFLRILGHGQGRLWIVYLIAVTKITDIGAYFVGRFLGTHKLCPKLSPKKTVEGAIGGFVSAVLMSVGVYYLGLNITFVQAIWLGALIGILAQLGDLSESVLKRDAVAKDSNVLPGLGGVLDMLDSLIFTIPAIYFFLKLL